MTRLHLWERPAGATLKGTNNSCERVIGWWVKERYWSKPGYKHAEPVLNASRLIVAMGNALDDSGFALAEVID